ncbi:HD-GYP domain-containing protein [Paenibacillus sp. YYML68]|uniref:HD-GYP domain-containing protein n=1 Tax=Paenibacillus sp. YYML68 TaxID=2909250 RepID=UPI0024933850|nr:HD-GYP domain-containing protein [Paenibacillus sp. YYML68]
MSRPFRTDPALLQSPSPAARSWKGRKFTILFMVFMFPVIGVLSAFFGQQWLRVRDAEQQLSAIEYIRDAASFLHQVEHHGIVLMLHQYDKQLSDEAVVKEQQRRIREHIEQLDQWHQLYGHLLDNSWLEIKVEYYLLANRSLRMDYIDSLYAHDRLIRHTVQFIEQAGTSLGLLQGVQKEQLHYSLRVLRMLPELSHYIERYRMLWMPAAMEVQSREELLKQLMTAGSMVEALAEKAIESQDISTDDLKLHRELWDQVMRLSGYTKELAVDRSDEWSMVADFTLKTAAVPDEVFRLMAYELDSLSQLLNQQHDRASRNVIALSLLILISIVMIGVVYFKEYQYNRMVRVWKHTATGLKDQALANQKLIIGIVEALNKALEAKDPYTLGHSERVSQYAFQLADRLGMSPVECEKARLAALFHDIGKIGIPDSILLKQGALTAEEFKEIKKHPIYSFNILKPVDPFGDILLGVLHHHENWDGSGYPEGIREEQIPLIASIIHVVDAYDAMTTKRSYRGSMSSEAALIELIRMRGKQFHPQSVDCFEQIVLEKMDKEK